MKSKWCSVCQEIVTCSFEPNYCCWCGKDLRNESILPRFATYEEREQIVFKLKNSEIPLKISEIKQIKLF